LELCHFHIDHTLRRHIRRPWCPIFARIDAKKDRSQPDLVPPKKDLTEEEAAAVATALYLHEKAD
jgi:hypothetical protein